MLFWVVFVMSQLPFRSLETQHFPQYVSCSNDGRQLNCALLTMSEMSNFPCQVFAFFEIVPIPSAPITIGIVITIVRFSPVIIIIIIIIIIDQERRALRSNNIVDKN